MSPTGNKELTREELYARVWSEPTTKVAAELGISDVALAKRCKRMNVPKPPLGYWARVAAGQKPKKMPLPKTPVYVKLPASKAKSGEQLVLEEDLERLHPVAQEVLKKLRTKRQGSRERGFADGPTVPHVYVSESLIEKAAKAVHAIIVALESDGIIFCRNKSKDSHARGYFEKAGDVMSLEIGEKYDWGMFEGSSADTRSRWSGRLSFTAHGTHIDGRNLFKRWAENDQKPLEELLFRVVLGIRKYFDDMDIERAQAAARKKREDEERKRWEADAPRREAEERRHKQAEALKRIEEKRARDLIKAAEWWRLYRVAMEFIEECERRWRKEPPGEVSAEQRAWLVWAQEQANALSPFEGGYPDPALDGPFDAEAVPFGGPYPPNRNFPTPPTMPEIPAQAQPGSQIYGYASEPKREYPFWLRNSR